MSYATPKHSKKEITKAGHILTTRTPDIDDLSWAYNILSNFRACHNYPMNTFQSTLRTKLKKIDTNALVAIRLKRIPSIMAKLSREQDMSLSRMQDIGGLRAIVKSIKQVKQLHSDYKNSKFIHELCGEKDYISFPKKSGYRDIHLVYKYKKRNESPYNGLRLELQIRTKVQHAWATAVETLGTFIDHSLKSSDGPEEWLAFFALAASAFAHYEGCPPVPGFEHLKKVDTYDMTVKEALRLDVYNHLLAYSNAVKAISSDATKGAYYLMMLDPAIRTISYKAYSVNHLEQANSDYLEAEKNAMKIGDKQIVLVSAKSIKALKMAYPNYFLDTHEFLKLLTMLGKDQIA